MTGLEMVLYIMGAFSVYLAIQIYNETTEGDEIQINWFFCFVFMCVWPVFVFGVMMVVMHDFFMNVGKKD